MNRIYYFSGTGNSLRSAMRIAEVLGNTEVVAMRPGNEEINAKDCDVIGFTFPVYHWTMPKPAVEFVSKLEINPNAYIFCVAMPSFICGAACEKLEELLSKKNAKISYGTMVNSVANYCIVYPPMPNPKCVVPRTEKKLTKIANEIKNRKIKDIPHANYFIRKRMKSFMEPYLAVQKYADYPFVIKETCISCGLCEKLCPVNNIKLVDGKPSFLHHCSQCMSCVVFCPKRAVTYEISSGDKELLNAYSKNTNLIKIMGLPEKRKRYHNPYINSGDLLKNRILINEDK